MMKVFVTLAGILIGPFVGFFVTHFLLYVRSLSHPDCMWRLGAFGMGVTVGAPPWADHVRRGRFLGRPLSRQADEAATSLPREFGLSKQRIRRVE